MKTFTIRNKNGVITKIHLTYSPANQAWLVWRSDGVYSSLPRIFNDQEAALREWKRKVAFLREVLALEAV